MARVVLEGPPPLHLHLAEFRGPSLDADLAGRDVTVDALAVDLGALLRGPAAVHDPTGGLGDLTARRLRACGASAFSDDLLRVLRLLRLAHQLGFAIETETETLARSAAPALASVSAERVRDELTNILRMPRSAPAIRQADAWSILRVVLPEIEAMREATQSLPHRFTVWEHSLRALEAGDALLADLRLLAPHDARVAAALAEPMGGGLTRREVWKLAVLLHDVAKPETRSVDADGRTRFIGHDRIGADRVSAIAARLRWPGRATDVLARLVRHHLRPMHLGMLDEITRRARYRFHRDVAEEVAPLVCLTIADAAGTDGRAPAGVYRAQPGCCWSRSWPARSRRRAKPPRRPCSAAATSWSSYGSLPGPASVRCSAAPARPRRSGSSQPGTRRWPGSDSRQLLARTRSERSGKP